MKITKTKDISERQEQQLAEMGLQPAPEDVPLWKKLTCGWAKPHDWVPLWRVQGAGLVEVGKICDVCQVEG